MYARDECFVVHRPGLLWSSALEVFGGVCSFRGRKPCAFLVWWDLAQMTAAVYPWCSSGVTGDRGCQVRILPGSLRSKESKKQPGVFKIPRSTTTRSIPVWVCLRSCISRAVVVEIGGVEVEIAFSAAIAGRAIG